MLAITGCDDSSAERARVSALTARCSINSDCDDPLVCAFGRCHEECSSSRDCPGRANCVKADQADLRVCQLESEVDCNRDGDCLGDQQCAADAECRDPCEQAEECAEHQVCVKDESVCAADDEVNAQGLLIIDRGNITLLSVSGPCPDGGTCVGLVNPGAPAQGPTTPSTSRMDAGASGAGGAGRGGSSGGGSDAGTDSGTGPARGDLEVDDPCTAGDQCESGVCEIVCLSPACDDGVQNGSEKGVDCGGSCLARCDIGTPCDGPTDCSSGKCTDGKCTRVVCPSEPEVASMVALPAGFCIDSTEVTRAQYTAWLAQGPSTSGQIAECDGTNPDYTPDPSCMTSACQGDCADHPQVCIDWCDAAAYCLGVGKRLCGHIDGTTTEHRADSLESEFYYACTSAGANAYTYGSAAVDSACNNQSAQTGTTEPVKSRDTCQSPVAGFGGVYDLTGNVHEWTNNCTSDGTCVARESGFFNSNNQPGRCSETTSHPRTYFHERQGFRCCATP